MKKFYFILLLISLIFAQAHAQVIDLGTGEEAKSAAEPAKESLKADAEIKPEDKKSSGIFSFMNFSFFKKEKKEETSATEETTESFLERMSRLSDEGDVEAQLSLGYAYLYGEDSIKVDYKKAVRYYALAAAQNDKVALNNLGSLYYSGIGVDIDKEKAASLFSKASELGNSEASVNLAFIYLSGSGIYRNYSEAMRLFKKAAEDNNPAALFMMGYAYHRGFYVKQNHKKAFELMKAAADSKYDEAQFMLGLMYLNGWGTTRNYNSAVRFFELASDQGNIDAMNELGSILALGKVYKQNVYRAYIIFNIVTSYEAPNAAEKRDKLEKSLEISDILEAQKEAAVYRENPSELTSYIRQTFGINIRNYIDNAMRGIKK